MAWSPAVPAGVGHLAGSSPSAASFAAAVVLQSGAVAAGRGWFLPFPASQKMSRFRCKPPERHVRESVLAPGPRLRPLPLILCLHSRVDAALGSAHILSAYTSSSKQFVGVQGDGNALFKLHVDVPRFIAERPELLEDATKNRERLLLLVSWSLFNWYTVGLQRRARCCLRVCHTRIQFPNVSWARFLVEFEKISLV